MYILVELTSFVFLFSVMCNKIQDSKSFIQPYITQRRYTSSLKYSITLNKNISTKIIHRTHISMSGKHIITIVSRDATLL